MWWCVLSLLASHLWQKQSHVQQRDFFLHDFYVILVLEMPPIAPEIDSAPTDRHYKYPSPPNPNPTIPLPPPAGDCKLQSLNLFYSSNTFLIKKHTRKWVSLATPSTPAAPSIVSCTLVMNTFLHLEPFTKLFFTMYPRSRPSRIWVMASSWWGLRPDVHWGIHFETIALMTEMPSGSCQQRLAAIDQQEVV